MSATAAIPRVRHSPRPIELRPFTPYEILTLEAANEQLAQNRAQRAADGTLPIGGKRRTPKAPIALPELPNRQADLLEQMLAEGWSRDEVKRLAWAWQRAEQFRKVRALPKPEVPQRVFSEKLPLRRRGAAVMHARVPITTIVLDVWENALAALRTGGDTQRRCLNKLVRLPIREVVRVIVGTFSAAFYAPVTFVGGCNDERGPDGRGNEWARMIAIAYNRPGEGYGRSVRRAMAQLEAEEVGFRVQRLEDGPPWAGFDAYPWPNHHIRNLVYLTADDLKQFATKDTWQPLVEALRQVCRRQTAAVTGQHERTEGQPWSDKLPAPRPSKAHYMWIVTQAARRWRKGGLGYVSSLTPFRDELSKRAKRAERDRRRRAIADAEARRARRRREKAGREKNGQCGRVRTCADDGPSNRSPSDQIGKGAALPLSGRPDRATHPGTGPCGPLRGRPDRPTPPDADASASASIPATSSPSCSGLGGANAPPPPPQEIDEERGRGKAARDVPRPSFREQLARAGPLPGFLQLAQGPPERAAAAAPEPPNTAGYPADGGRTS